MGWIIAGIVVYVIYLLVKPKRSKEEKLKQMELEYQQLQEETKIKEMEKALSKRRSEKMGQRLGYAFLLALALFLCVTIYLGNKNEGSTAAMTPEERKAHYAKNVKVVASTQPATPTPPKRTTLKDKLRKELEDFNIQIGARLLMYEACNQRVKTIGMNPTLALSKIPSDRLGKFMSDTEAYRSIGSQVKVLDAKLARFVKIISNPSTTVTMQQARLIRSSMRSGIKLMDKMMSTCQDYFGRWGKYLGI